MAEKILTILTFDEEIWETNIRWISKKTEFDISI